MEDLGNKANTFESGSDRSTSASTTPALLSASQRVIRFGSKQGYRRRHPYAVLGQYAGVVSNSLENPKNTWEHYLEKEHERTALPKEYMNDSVQTQIITQPGLRETADVNYKSSKPKLSMFASSM